MFIQFKWHVEIIFAKVFLERAGHLAIKTAILHHIRHGDFHSLTQEHIIKGTLRDRR